MEKEKKPKSKLRKIIDGLVVGVFGSILVVVLAFNVINNISNKRGDGMVFGMQYPVVLTDSMEPEYMVKDVLIVKKVKPADIKVGDDISFYYDIERNGKERSVTHRISNIVVDISKEEGQGRYTFTAHGINKQSEQCGGGDCTYQTQTFNETKVIGRVSKRSSFLTNYYKLSTSILGLIIFILVPCLYLVVTSVLDITKALREGEDGETSDAPIVDAIPIEKTKDDPLAGLSEDEKEALKKQMLDEILGGKKK